MEFEEIEKNTGIILTKYLKMTAEMREPLNVNVNEYDECVKDTIALTNKLCQVNKRYLFTKLISLAVEGNNTHLPTYEIDQTGLNSSGLGMLGSWNCNLENISECGGWRFRTLNQICSILIQQKKLIFPKLKKYNQENFTRFIKILDEYKDVLLDIRTSDNKLTLSFDSNELSLNYNKLGSISEIQDGERYSSTTINAEEEDEFREKFHSELYRKDEDDKTNYNVSIRQLRLMDFVLNNKEFILKNNYLYINKTNKYLKRIKEFHTKIKPILAELMAIDNL